MTDLIRQFVEVLVLAAGIYAILRFLGQTRGSGVLRGLALVLFGGTVGFTVLIDTFELARLEYVFNALRNTAVIGLIIVFQPEIRKMIVHLGDSPIFGRIFRREMRAHQRLLRSIARLSKERIGALIAIERESSLAQIAQSGVQIDAELESSLIESIFHPGGALHDGAVVVRGDRIAAASCLLPLTQSDDVDRRLGTRHRAAIGLVEETDALVLVVSEETGKVSAALGGKLHYGITLEEVERILDESLGGRRRSPTIEEAA
jgi:diadenylate cyclase